MSEPLSPLRHEPHERAEPRAARANVLTAISLFCAAGGIGGYACLPDSQAHAAANVEAHVLGERVADNADVKELALRAARAYLSAKVKLVVGPWEFNTTR